MQRMQVRSQSHLRPIPAEWLLGRAGRLGVAGRRLDTAALASGLRVAYLELRSCCVLGTLLLNVLVLLRRLLRWGRGSCRLRCCRPLLTRRMRCSQRPRLLCPNSPIVRTASLMP